MSKLKKSFLLLLGVGLAVVSASVISAKSAESKSSIAIREVEKQVVLYTIHRGNYAKTGPVIGKLFALAGRKGIKPAGPISYVYLNNPRYVSPQHWLTEIRVPVSKEALKLAGTLGEMTDVKEVPAVKLAVAQKPEGREDPSAIYEQLHIWIYESGYVHIEDPQEKFLSNASAGSYAQMKTEIMIPVMKVAK